MNILSNGLKWLEKQLQTSTDEPILIVIEDGTEVSVDATIVAVSQTLNQNGVKVQAIRTRFLIPREVFASKGIRIQRGTKIIYGGCQYEVVLGPKGVYYHNDHLNLRVVVETNKIGEL